MVSFGPCRLVVILVEAVFPATSVAVTDTASEPWVIWSVQLKLPDETVAGVPLQETVSIPESPSLTSPLTTKLAVGVTLPLGGDVMLTNGAVWSKLTVIEVVAEFPALSVAVPVKV